MTILSTTMKILTLINNLLLKTKLNSSDKNTSPNKLCQILKIKSLKVPTQIQQTMSIQSMK